MAQLEAERPWVTARARLNPCRSRRSATLAARSAAVGRRWRWNSRPGPRDRNSRCARAMTGSGRARCRGHKRRAAGRTRHARSPTGWRRRMLDTSRQDRRKTHIDARTGRPTNKIATKTACPPAPQRYAARPAPVALGGDPWRRQAVRKVHAPSRSSEPSSRRIATLPSSRII